MSMKNDWLKNNLQDRLADKPSDFDMDSMWNEIQAKRAPKKDRRIIWIPTILLTAIIGSVLLYQNLRNTNSVSTNEQTAANINTDSALESLKTQQTQQTKVIEAETAQESSATNSDIIKSSVNKPKQSINNRSTNTSIVNELTNNILPIKTASNANSNNHRPEISTQQNLNSYITSPAVSNKTSIMTSPISNSIVKLSEPESIHTHNTESIGIIECSLIPILSHVQLSDYPRYDDLNKRMAAFLPSKSTAPSASKINRLPIRLGFEFTFGESQRTLTSENPDLENWLTVRNVNEEMLDQLSGAFTMRIPLHRGFYLQTGLEYQQYTSKLSTEVYDFSTELIKDTISILVNPQGMVISAMEGDVIRQNSIMTRYTRFQKYRSVGIPLLAGKNFKLSDKGQLSLNAGVLVSLSSFNTGEIQKNALSPDDFGEMETLGYDVNLQWQSSVSAEYHYSISKSTALYGGVMLRNDLTNRANQASDISDKFQSYNLKIGWMKSF